MSTEHHQAYMEGFGRALLMEDYIIEDDFGDDDFDEEDDFFGAAAFPSSTRSHVRYDLGQSMDKWLSRYRPTHKSREKARRAAAKWYRYIVPHLAKAYGVGRTTVARLGSGTLRYYQGLASDKAASW